MAESSILVDIAGVGLNATDTLIRLPHFPAFNSKVEFRQSEVLPGGQVAYGILQQEAMRIAGIEAHWIVVPGCQSQSSFILVDEETGERTVLWKRDPRLELLPSEIQRDWVTESRLLHVDGHDCSAAAAAARWARSASIPVTADLDNLYPGVKGLLENVDFALTSKDFPGRLTGENDLLVSLPRIASRFGCRLVAATLGADGVLAWDGTRFHYSPAFDLKPVDTTGAGDVFHAAFAYCLLQGCHLPRSLEFSCAAAGLGCMGLGARGAIATLGEIEDLVREGRRRPPAYAQDLLEAGRISR